MNIHDFAWLLGSCQIYFDWAFVFCIFFFFLSCRVAAELRRSWQRSSPLHCERQCMLVNVCWFFKYLPRTTLTLHNIRNDAHTMQWKIREKKISSNNIHWDDIWFVRFVRLENICVCIGYRKNHMQVAVNDFCQWWHVEINAKMHRCRITWRFISKYWDSQLSQNFTDCNDPHGK